MSFSAKGLHARRFKTSRTVFALMLREMVTTHGRSPGGYVWVFLEPIAGLAVMSLAFSMAFRSPALGNNFPLFYATGYLPFMMYSDLSAKITQSIRFSKPLLFYPAVTYVDTILARMIFNIITHVIVFYVVMFGIIFVFDIRNTLYFPAMVNALTMAGALGVGIGTLNCFLHTRFPLLERVWTIVSRPLFLISAIFFLFETIPQPFRDYLGYNPLVHVVGEMRRGFYPTYDAPYVSSIYVYSISAICLMLGLIFLNRYHRELLNNNA